MQLLKECQNPEGMEELIDIADTVLQNLQPTWSKFIPGKLREEALSLFKGLSDIQCHSEGGYKSAERQRLLIEHLNNPLKDFKQNLPISGLRIAGNFLFDKPSSDDFRLALEELGIPLEDIGDIWIKKDRGANAFCSKEIQTGLNGLSGKLRDVGFYCETASLSELDLPPDRIEKEMSTVEASCRIDAIASAGFGISRAKVVKQIKQGGIRLNWDTISQPSKLLAPGDRIQHHSRGVVEIISVECTKRQRWRIVMRRT